MAVKEFNVAVALVFDDRERVLLVRKRNTDHFQLPGGKIERGETATDTVFREVKEEVQLELNKDSLQLIGEANGKAMTDYDAIVRAQVFAGDAEGNATPASEIEELCWYDLNEKPSVRLALVLETQTLPMARDLLANRSRTNVQVSSLKESFQ
ncbi:NUDIX hydrolase [Maritalea sp.]|jgi:8-oxo-dGTP diphosphatase|uniref:NUDIX hydrolase n=1 Tax=Maritalea sp. TaxID=2003361 RepID=UPI0039E4E93A